MDWFINPSVQAKENADDLVASKKELDAQVEANRKKTKEFEVTMRQRTSTVGNIVGKAVPVSLTEVHRSPRSIILV
jgi:seryl-tRNA synthetase